MGIFTRKPKGNELNGGDIFSVGDTRHYPRTPADAMAADKTDIAAVQEGLGRLGPPREITPEQATVEGLLASIMHDNK